MQGNNIALVVEKDAFEGVKRIADIVAGDFEKVTDKKPIILNEIADNICEGKGIILCATVNKSHILEKLEAEGKLDLSQLRGKREVFEICFVDNMLIICGSDKRGTIYGMFTLSEYIGVSSLTFWGDVIPQKQPNLVIKKDIEQISKEPSVKYRGFFINDEWPCFGNWVCSHFGGFNAKAYEKIFEFLLRMKGNYLWPAMWSASFPLDGPGNANEELADLYGVIVGYSHHEPCLRASEEWDKVRGEQSKYGNEWNFYTNEKGLLEYWKDALKRSGAYENMITIGMRGERDTSMLGENATVEENVKLLKDIIKKQRLLISECVASDADKVPQLLALYKEVEQYFYGDENQNGLQNYEELENVICMLCEDNFGNMRTLPTEKMRRRAGGFGMYYHLDYHGGPISYEWVDSTPFKKIWEQMGMAYEYGVREAWIVNVGDLKLHEVPLTYFMALAYDYEKWGYENPNSVEEYLEKWVKQNFAQAEQKLQKDIAYVLREYIDINHLRRPEALHSGIYHASHYLENDRMLERAENVEKLTEKIYKSLPQSERKAFYSMIYYSAMASMNLLKMHLYAGKNQYYAKQGRTIANQYAELTAECISKDRQLARDFADFNDGKWKGMELAPHIGFTKWNEDDCRYPVICRVEPAYKPRMKVSRADEEFTAVKNYGEPMRIIVDDFSYAGSDEVVLEISNDGIGKIHYEITASEGKIPDWLELSSLKGTVEIQENVKIRVLRDKMTQENEKVRLFIKDNETCVAVDIFAKRLKYSGLPDMTFLPGKNGIIMLAKHFAAKKDVPAGDFEVIDDYGKYGSALKVFPSTAVFDEMQEKPTVTYRFLIEEAGEYSIELLTAPFNSVVNKQAVNITMQINKNVPCVVEILPSDFRAGENSDERWTKGVLDQIRVVSMVKKFDKGVQELTLGAMEVGLVLECIRIYSVKRGIKESYLGPKESEWIVHLANS